MRKLVLCTLAVGLLLTLSGCDSKNRTYATVEELKVDFIKSGGQCWEWNKSSESDLQIMKQTGHGECDSRTVLMTFPNIGEAEKSAIELAKTIRSLKLGPVNMLFGKNWLINSDQVEKVQRKLGGTLITR